MQRPTKDSPFSAVAYYSRQTSPEEARFTSYDLETLAVVMSVKQFRAYLLGLKFTIVTDCNSVRATFEKKDMLPRVVPKGIRWHLLRSNHDMLGHFCFEKTYDKIKSQYWFAKMRRFIRLECAHTKVPPGKRSGELHPIPKVDLPFHTLHIDDEFISSFDYRGLY